MKQLKDKYYTPETQASLLVEETLKNFPLEGGYTYVEFCAGAGAILEAMLSAGIPKAQIKAYDISPDVANYKGIDITQQDVFKITEDLLDFDKVVCITNPPFSGSRAIKVMNHLKEVGCTKFTLLMPPIKRAKTLKKLNEFFHLTAEAPLVEAFHFVNFDGTEYENSNPINCTLQTYKVKDVARKQENLPELIAGTNGVTNYVVSPCNRFKVVNYKSIRWGEDAPEGVKAGGVRPVGANAFDATAFTISSHSNIGKVKDFEPELDKPSVRFFVEVFNQSDIKAVREMFEEHSFSDLKGTGKLGDSATPDEILWSIERRTK